MVPFATLFLNVTCKSCDLTATAAAAVMLFSARVAPGVICTIAIPYLRTVVFIKHRYFLRSGCVRVSLTHIKALPSIFAIINPVTVIITTVQGEIQ